MSRALVYRTLWFLAGGAFKVANGCLYLAAGLLREDELQAASEARWREFGTSVPDADAGLSAAEQAFYSRFLRGADRILLVGSGGGRDLFALHAMGLRLTGLEQVPELVEVARAHAARRGLDIRIQAGTIQTTQLDGPFDAVIFSLGCYSYVQRSAARVAALGRVNQHLVPGGCVLVSYHPFHGASPIGRWLTYLSARLSRAGWLPERGDAFSRDYMTPRVLRYQHEFEPDEFARECAEAGFQVVADEPLGGLRFAAVLRRGEAPAPVTSARIVSHTAGRTANDLR